MKLRDIRFLRLVFVFMCLSLETIAKEIRVGDYFYELNGMEAILMDQSQKYVSKHRSL